MTYCFHDCFPSVKFSLKTFLRTTYDSEAVSLTNGYGKWLEKLAKFRNHVIFTARCKKTGLIPPSLKINPPIATERGRAIAGRASRQFLDECLRVANYKVRQLEDERKWTELGSHRRLSTDDFERVDKDQQGTSGMQFHSSTRTTEGEVRPFRQSWESQIGKRTLDM